MDRKNKGPWSSRNNDDSDSSSGNDMIFGARSSSTSTDTSSESSVEKEQPTEMEYLCIPGGSYDIISNSSIQQLVQKIDGSSSLDDQGCDMIAKIADAFVNDVAVRMVKLAKHRKDKVGLLDLKVRPQARIQHGVSQ
ncbi:transcription initiation factor TFIID subunit 12 [Drosophila eugracilis]|uniref:transcription initiation factor TFIID subunit 12 n=1 Tax=Drosophila eugracilis TaxID=29029 RepID=UPI001BD9638B|nr:transcription initiation factor TFIID subunit 12 [Drosophila eugracilis]